MAISFYILKSAHYTPLSLTCRLVEKAFLQKMRVFLLTETEDQSTQFDQALWTFKDISFIPHEIWHENFSEDKKSPAPSWMQVHILTFSLFKTLSLETFIKSSDVLINHAWHCSERFLAFRQIIEIVTLSDSTDILKKNRQKYKFYKDFQATSSQIQTHYL